LEDLELQRLVQIKELIENNLADTNVTNDWVAAELMLSTRTLYRIIQNLTGKTPNHYIRSIRLEKAYELLEIQKYSTVKEVVAQIGFKKVDYFSLLFKEKYGFSPVEVLKGNRRKLE